MAEQEHASPKYSKSLTMYSLFIGFRKFGEFPTISEAKRFARDSGLSGVFSLLGDNYSDSWYVHEERGCQV